MRKIKVWIVRDSNKSFWIAGRKKCPTVDEAGFFRDANATYVCARYGKLVFGFLKVGKPKLFSVSFKEIK